MESFFVDNFSEEIWRTKYKGNAEDVEVYYNRLARIVSLGDEKLAKKFAALLFHKRFSPGGRILAFGGRPHANLSLMNCTTHTIEDDSLEAISNTVYSIMRSSSRWQGIGIDLSNLRPNGSPVNNAAKTSTGAISFMEMLNNVGGTIGQEGRRAALLFSLDVKHPDLYRPDDKSTVCPKCFGVGCGYCKDGYIPYDFLHIKKHPGRVENANISVKVSDDFMISVKQNKEWLSRFVGKSDGDVFFVDRKMMAADLFTALARSAHSSAEPGLLYWDTSKRMSNSDLFGDRWRIVGTNACSEEILDQDGVCNLGSMNLAAYVTDPYTSQADFDFDSFHSDVETAIEFLDNIVTLEIENGNYISKTQLESLESLRRLGLGVMGTADMMAMLGAPYGSEESAIALSTVFTTLRNASYEKSIKLAREKGAAKVWDDADDYHCSIIDKGFFATLPDRIRDDIVRYGLRNITLLSIAPTGSISNLYGVSSGIEPLFAHSYTRRTRINGSDEFIDYVHPGVAKAGSAAAELYPTAYEVSPYEHINMQSIAQQHVDASIAKTLNFPETAEVADIAAAYLHGWEEGLKGLAVYVNNSRTDQVLYTQGKDNACDSCGSELVFKDGCEECPTCGYGKCSL